MSPLLRSIFNALMGINNKDISRDFFFDERDNDKLEMLLAEKSITLSKVGAHINFYPGNGTGTCHEHAVFVSLKNQPRGARLKLKEQLTFSQLLKAVVRHCQGLCIHKTRSIHILTDSFDNDTYKYWEDNLREIWHKGVSIEFILLVGVNEVEVNLK